MSATRLALSLVKEIIADKRQRHLIPDYALRGEVYALVGHALDTMVENGSLILHNASVNRYPAYEIPESCQPQPPTALNQEKA